MQIIICIIIIIQSFVLNAFSDGFSNPMLLKNFDQHVQ